MRQFGLVDGNNRATARFLNVCPYLATSVLFRRPQVLGSIEASGIVTRRAMFRAAMIYFGWKRFFADEKPFGITSNAKTIRSSSDSNGIV